MINNIQALKASAIKVLHGGLMMVVPLEKVLAAEKELSELEGQCTIANLTEAEYNSVPYRVGVIDGEKKAFREVLGESNT